MRQYPPSKYVILNETTHDVALTHVSLLKHDSIIWTPRSWIKPVQNAHTDTLVCFMGTAWRPVFKHGGMSHV